MVRLGREKQNMMSGVLLNEKSFDWICFILKEASSDQKNLVSGWRQTPGRRIFWYQETQLSWEVYVYLIIEGRGQISYQRIIILETGISAVWRRVALKMENFIKCSP